MNTEQIRQQYLQALGIESYLPRWQLPAAAPSPLPVEDVDELQELRPAESLAHALQPTVPTHQGAPLRPRLEVELETKQARQKIAAEAAPLVAQSRASRSPRFMLGIWQISPHILVLDSRQPGQALPVGRLLQNIALALGLDGRLPPLETLRWPLADGSDSHNTEADARARLRAFLAARAGVQPIAHVLLMGGPAVRFAVHEEQLADVDTLRALLGKTLPLRLEDFSVEGIALPSLATLLKQPERKADAWAAIKHLRQARRA